MAGFLNRATYFLYLWQPYLVVTVHREQYNKKALRDTCIIESRDLFQRYKVCLFLPRNTSV